MEKRDYYPILESILFTMGKSVEIKTLAEALKLTQEEIKQILQDMSKEYSEKQRGIQLVFLEDSVQLCTKPQYYEYLIRIASRPQKQVLSDSVLETLSIVAYKQPVTRGEIERIRGVKSDHAIAKLMDYDLIEEIGRLDAPGRPVLFATTEEFLRCFGVSSVAELPLTTFLGRAVYVDFKETVAKRGHITAADLDREAGKVREGDIVIIDSSYKLYPFTPDTNTDKDQRLLVGAESAEWFKAHKVKAVGFGDGVSIENCNEDVKPFHDILMAENIVFLEVLRNLEQLKKDVFFMSYSPLPILGLDSSPVRAYAIEGLAEFSE